MAKRQNRLKAIEHEQRQLENLKTLEPNTTPEEAQLFSRTLIDIAIAALEEVSALEAGEPPELKRLQRLYDLVEALPKLLKG